MKKKMKKNLRLVFRLFWIFIIGRIFGFIYENILVLFQKGHFELRQGLLYGPLIPVYGAGAVIYELIVPKMESSLEVFLKSIFLGGVTEYICSYLQEVLFGTISWDYHWVTINFNGRTSLLHMFYWGMAGVAFYHIVHPWFDKIITGEITQRAITITSILAVFIVCDVFISWSASFRQKERVLEMPAKTSWDCFLDTYYPDERIDRIYTNKIVTMDRCM